ncbi:MAG: transposase [Acidimicrobiia bacterium]|nr:transposase [Acidimicrobiia bacterium]
MLAGESTPRGRAGEALPTSTGTRCGPLPAANGAEQLEARVDHVANLKHTRWALVKDPNDLSDAQLDLLHTLRRERSVLYRWQLKEALRDLFRLADPADAPAHLRVVAGLGLPVPHPRLRHLLQDRASQPGAHPRCRRARPVELEARGAQPQDPLDQPPRLRPPLSSRLDRHHLPLLRRHHRRPALRGLLGNGAKTGSPAG